ncbi:caffeine-induced death protein 2 [Absidia repens]|uniref:Caffeine-induced death protein 2 n=1 Tax=Absidia repens TaxID=90262 RepID=A0A1X2HZH9_9FUNG|nr:caffeine-induced death protein 2 [Absidia repens]
MSDKTLSPTTCSNFSFFKEMMKELRRVDDNIILGLNSTDTHSENACGDFFKRLATAYRKREEAVDYCLKVMDAEIDRKTILLQEDPDDYDTQSSIFSDETKRRMIANELVVEGIVRDRTLQVFKSKCRVFDVSSLQTK